MINYRPICSISDKPSTQNRLRSKFGGLPWGLPDNYWPSQDVVLLAQLVHDPPAIDLGGENVAFIWHWIDPDKWQDPPRYRIDKSNGFILPQNKLLEGLVEPAFETECFQELLIDGWEAIDDNLADAPSQKYTTYDGLRELGSNAILDSKFWHLLSTKFGGVPHWRGSSGLHELPEGCDFLFQTDGSVWLGDEKSEQQTGAVGIEENAGGKIASITDFGDAGVAFVFLDHKTTPTSIRWTWSS